MCADLPSPNLSFRLGQHIHGLLLVYKDLAGQTGLVIESASVACTLQSDAQPGSPAMIGGSAPTSISSRRFFFLALTTVILQRRCAQPHRRATGLADELQLLLDVLR